MAELKVDVTLEGITSAYVDGPFDEATRILNENGYRIISSEENALLRMQCSKDSDVSWYGNLTRECFVYVPKGGIYLVKHSPILDDAKEVVRKNWRCIENYISHEEVDRILEDSVRIPTCLLPTTRYGLIPTNRFGDEEVTAYLFGEQAKPYGKFLKDAGIEEMQIELLIKSHYSQGLAFVRQLWFSSLNYQSELGGTKEKLHLYRWLRGIKDSKGVTQKKEKEKLIYINPFEVEFQD